MVNVPGTRPRHPLLPWLLLGALVVVIGSSVALAQETRLGGKVRAGGQVTIAADETVPGNLYVSGGQIRVEGVIEGDLVVAGLQVTLPGEVQGDVVAGTGNLDISGDVGGSIRAGAGQVTLGGSVEGDLAVGTGQVTVTTSGRVGEDFIFGSGQATMDGEVAGDVLGSTGNYVRRGTVGGTEDVTIARDREPTAADQVLGALGRFVAVLAIGALFLWLWPRPVDGTAWTLRRRPWGSLGVGLLGIVGFVVAVLVVILAVVLIALLLGLLQLGDLLGVTIFGGGTALTVLVFLFFLAVFFVVHAAVGMFLGRLVAGAGPYARWVALFVGVLVVVALTSIPVVGGWFGVAIVVFGLGALILEFWSRRRAPATTPAAPPPAPA
jgi:cytoskeletal protein CcmA (bactofilin family)